MVYCSYIVMKTVMIYKKSIILLFFIVIFAYMMVINFNMPLWADDWGSSDITNILKSVYLIYFHWSGRIAPYFLGGLFSFNNTLSLGVFNIFNSLFFVALIYFIFLLAYSRKPKNLGDLAALLLIFGLVWFMPVTFGEVVLWKSASTVYLWSITATLIFIYPYKKLLEYENIISDNFVNRVLFLIIGALLGTCLENLSLAICFILICILCYKKKKGGSIVGWAYAGVSGYILGTIVLIAAPGNYARLDAAHKIIRLSLLQKGFLLSGQMILHFLPFIFLCIIIFALRCKLKQKNNCHELKWFYFFLVLTFLSAVIMGGAPGALFYGRTTFISDVFAIIAVISLMRIDGNKYFKRVVFLLVIIVLSVQIFDMVKTYRFYNQLHYQVVQRENLIKAMGPYNKNISIAPIYFSRQITTFNTSNIINIRRLYASDITSDSVDWRNSLFGKYYDLSSVKLVPDLIFSNTLPKTKTNAKFPYKVVVRDNKIYYINTTTSCDKIKNKQNFLLNVYPRNWFSNKLYIISEIFDLQEKKNKIKSIIRANKNPLAIFDPKLWLNWQEMKSNFNNFDFTWNEAKRVTVLTNDFHVDDNVCVLVAYLPSYSVDSIETGQVKNNKQVWETIIQIN